MGFGVIGLAGLHHLILVFFFLGTEERSSFPNIQNLRLLLSLGWTKSHLKVMWGFIAMDTPYISMMLYDDIRVPPCKWGINTNPLLHMSKLNQVTDHLNQMDKSGNIKFTRETEKDGNLPFLDALAVRDEKMSPLSCLSSIKRPTQINIWTLIHIIHYINDYSHHPLHKRLGVIWWLLDTVTE